MSCGRSPARNSKRPPGSGARASASRSSRVLLPQPLGPTMASLATRAQFQRRHPQAVALATGAVAAGDLVQAQDHGSVDSGTRYSASPASASPNRTQLATSLWKVS